MLKKRKLGRTDLWVSEIGLGCSQLGGQSTINEIPLTWSNVNEKTAEKIITTALECGINIFDTADTYSLGNSERRLGKAIKERRSEVYIFTKGGSVPSYKKPSPFEIDLSHNHLMASIDRSLKRLGTDYVDLFQTHYIPYSEKEYINVEKTFNEIKAQGKARYCGVSLSSEYERGIDLIERGIVDVIQLTFSLLDFEPVKKLLPLAKKKGIGVIASKPLAQGFLTEKYGYEASFPKTDSRSRLGTNEIKEKLEKCKKFQFLTNETRSMNQIAISYILSRSEVSTCIPGANSVNQVISNVQSSNILLTFDEIKKIDEVQLT